MASGFSLGAHRISKAFVGSLAGIRRINRKSEGGGHVDVAVERRRKPLREPAVVLVRRNARHQLRLRHLQKPDNKGISWQISLQMTALIFFLTRQRSRFLPYRAHGGNPASARDRPAQPVLPTPGAVAMTRLARVITDINQALGLQKRINLRRPA